MTAYLRHAASGVLLAATLAGCATDPCCRPVKRAPPVACCQTTVNCDTQPCQANASAEATAALVGTGVETAPLPAPARLLAVGYGAQGNYSQYSHGQQQLMAMRAAQVDAYRNLAEQVYGFRVWGNTAVSAFATQNDSVRTYVDAFIRGARVVNMTSIANGNYEATVELDLTRDFYQRLTQNATQGMPAPVRNTNGPCAAAGCSMPSPHYVTQ
jgi:hypothetical protein